MVLQWSLLLLPLLNRRSPLNQRFLYVSILSTDAPRKEYYHDHESQDKGVIKYVQLRLQRRDRGGQGHHITRSRRPGAYTKPSDLN